MEEKRDIKPEISGSITQRTYKTYAKYLGRIKDACKEHGAKNTWDLIGKKDENKQPIIGARLAYILKDSKIEEITVNQFIDALQRTRRPVQMNEQEGNIDGSDWTELENGSLLNTPIKIRGIKPHSDSTVQRKNNKTFTEEELKKQLINTTTIHGVCGTLFRGKYTNDEKFLQEKIEAFKKNGEITGDKAFEEAYYELVKDRFLPSLLDIQSEKGPQLVSTPIVGGGAFAGRYGEEVKKAFPQVIKRLFYDYDLNNIKGFIIVDDQINIESSLMGKEGEDTLLIHAPSDAAFKHRRIYQEAAKKVWNFAIGDEVLLGHGTHIWSAGDPLAMPGCEAARGAGAQSFDAAMGLFTDLLLKVYKKITGWIDPETNKMKHINAKDYDKDLGAVPTFENTCDKDEIQLELDTIRVFDDQIKNSKIEKHKIKKNEHYAPTYLKVGEWQENNGVQTFRRFNTVDFEKFGDEQGKNNTCTRSLKAQKIINDRRDVQAIQVEKGTGGGLSPNKKQEGKKTPSIGSRIKKFFGRNTDYPVARDALIGLLGGLAAGAAITAIIFTGGAVLATPVAIGIGVGTVAGFTFGAMLIGKGLKYLRDRNNNEDDNPSPFRGDGSPVGGHDQVQTKEQHKNSMVTVLKKTSGGGEALHDDLGGEESEDKKPPDETVDDLIRDSLSANDSDSDDDNDDDNDDKKSWSKKY